MEFNNDEILNDRDNHSNQNAKNQPEAYQVDDENLKEDDLERNLYGNNRDNMKPVMEGKPMEGDISARRTSAIKNEIPKPEKVERGNGENDRPHKGEQYQERTDDDANKPNIPGPNELPDQQLVGEDDDDREHIET